MARARAPSNILSTRNTDYRLSDLPNKKIKNHFDKKSVLDKVLFKKCLLTQKQEQKEGEGGGGGGGDQVQKCLVEVVVG